MSHCNLRRPAAPQLRPLHRRGEDFDQVVVAGVRPLDACRRDGRTFSPNFTSNGLVTVSPSFKLMTLAKFMAAPNEVVDREDSFAAIIRCTADPAAIEL
jgi:hypothetical protein